MPVRIVANVVEKSVSKINGKILLEGVCELILNSGNPRGAL